MKKVYIINAKRSAIGKFLGSFYEADISNVSSQVIKKGFEKEQKYFNDIDFTIIGNVVSAGLGQGIARKISINSGIPESTPAYSVSMVCGSGMQAIRSGISEIECGANLVLCGGIEFMSNIPYATNSYIRLGKKFGDFTMMDLMTHDGLIDSFSGVHMGVTAENIAKKYNITREEQEEYSYNSIQRAIKAIDSGCFKEEIVPVALKDYKNREYIFEIDEFANRESTLEKMKTLKTTFIKDETGTITAATTSGINDGVSFLLIASEDYVKKNNIKPLAEIVNSSVVGIDPQVMGLAPAYAIKKLLEKENMNFNDIDYYEMNEAFAAQALGAMRILQDEYKISKEEIITKTNVYGSGLGLGHPLGCTGARIATTLTYILKNKNAKYGIATLCIGGGMGEAILLQKVNEDEF
jgi:acetyl-CoA C-acetyltransferase